jgi:hypothetical protein
MGLAKAVVVCRLRRTPTPPRMAVDNSSSRFNFRCSTCYRTSTFDRDGDSISYSLRNVALLLHMFFLHVLMKDRPRDRNHKCKVSEKCQTPILARE